LSPVERSRQIEGIKQRIEAGRVSELRNDT
jgi:hypothetical protein